MKQLVFALFTVSLIATSGCTDRSKTKALQNQPTPNIESENIEIEKQNSQPSPMPETSVAKNSNLDQTIARIAETELHDPSAQDAQLALRITNVNFDISKEKSPELSLATYSGIEYSFNLDKLENDVYYYSEASSSETSSYTAQAKKVDDSIYLLSIQEVETAALIKILYVKKTGSSKIILQPKLNYKELLSIGSNAFIKRIRKNPTVEAEFYILLSRTTSEISRFSLKISDLFKLGAKFDEYSVKDENLMELPTVVEGLGFWRDLRFKSSSYKFTTDYGYILEQNLLQHPIFYNQMNFNFSLLALEKIAGSKTLPAKLEISFEKK